jgi:ribonuclease HII
LPLFFGNIPKMKGPGFKFEKKYWEQGMEHVAGVDEVGKGCFAGPVVAGCVVFSELGPAGSSSQPTSSGISPAGGRWDSLRFRHPIGKGVARDGEPQVRGPVLASRRNGLGAIERQDPGDIRIDDSKKMKPAERKKADIWIKKNALAWGIGEVSAGKINSLGMARASRMAFRRAVADARKKLGKPIDFLLADAFFTSYIPGLPTKRRKRKNGRYYKKIVGRQEPIVGGDTKSFSIAAASIVAKVYRDDLMLKLDKKATYKHYGWGRNKGYGTAEHRAAILRHGTTRQHRKLWIETWKSKLKEV